LFIEQGRDDSGIDLVEFENLGAVGGTCDDANARVRQVERIGYGPRGGEVRSSVDSGCGDPDDENGRFVGAVSAPDDGGRGAGVDANR
jgi:hypothetical protein